MEDILQTLQLVALVLGFAGLIWRAGKRDSRFHSRLERVERDVGFIERKVQREHDRRTAELDRLSACAKDLLVCTARQGESIEGVRERLAAIERRLNTSPAAPRGA